MLDMYGCEGELGNAEFVRQLLDELPGHINMTKIEEPRVTFYPGKEDSFDKGGVSGFVLIAESHITLHTFMLQKYVSFDIFSCKNFDIDKAIGILKKLFKPKIIEKNLVMRGRHFPRDVEVVKAMVGRHRTALRRNL